MISISDRAQLSDTDMNQVLLCCSRGVTASVTKDSVYTKASSSRPINSARTHIQTHTHDPTAMYTPTHGSFLHRQPVTLYLYLHWVSLLLSTNQTYCITTTNTSWLTVNWISHKLWRSDRLVPVHRAWCTGSFESRGQRRRPCSHARMKSYSVPRFPSLMSSLLLPYSWKTKN